MEDPFNSSNEELQILSLLNAGKFDTAVPQIVSSYEDGKALIFSDKSTPLHYACQHGSLHISKLLITKYHQKIDSKNDNGFTPLYITALYGHADHFKYLLNMAFVSELSLHFQDPKGKLCDFLKSVMEEKFKNNHSDYNGNTLLHAACSSGISLLVQYLIQLGFNPNVSNKDGSTCLQVATAQGKLEVVKFLLEEASNVHDLTVRSLPYQATRAGHLHVLRYLVEDKKIDCSLSVPSTSESGRTLLHVACSERHLNLVKYLILRCGLNIFGKDAEGRTSLYLACQNGHLDVLKCLVQLGSLSTIDQFCHVSTNLSESLKSMFQQNLLKHHSDNDGNTPIHASSMNSNSLHAVQFLVELTNFNFSSTNKEGMTCLHVAAEHGIVAMVKYLLDQSLCDHSLVDSHGRSPAYIAAGNGHLDVIKYMIEEKGADCQFKTAKEWRTEKLVYSPGWTLLHVACLGGHLDVIKYLVFRIGSDVSAKDDQGVTPLLLASRYGSLELFQFLIASDPALCDVSISFRNDKWDTLSKSMKSAFQRNLRKHKSNKGSTLLHTACMSSSDCVKIVEYLHEIMGFNPNYANREGMTCLHLAALCGNINVVRYLLERVHSDHSVLDSRGMSPAFLAASRGHLHILKYLIEEKGANSHVRTTKTWRSSKVTFASGRTLLHAASREGHFDVVKYLVEKCGCSPFVKDKENTTCLYLACQEGHLKVVKYLVALGCDLHEKSFSGRTCLHGAAMGGQIELVKYFDDVSIIDTDCGDENGVTPLHCACVRGNKEIINHLIVNWKCSLSLTTILGQSCLHFACLGNDVTNVKFLIENFDCSPLCKDYQENSLLHIACSQGNIELVDYLVSNQYCDPHARNVMGSSCLHAACSSGNLELVRQLLVEYNCDQNCEDVDGFTPLHVACSSGNLDLIKYLLAQSPCDAVCRTAEGKSCLHIAIGSQTGGKSALRIVKFLVEDYKCSPFCEDGKMDATPLHVACSLGDMDTALYLIEECKCNPNVLDSDMRTCFYDAVQSSNLDLVKYLADSCKCDPWCMDKNGVTPLHLACICGNLEMVQYLIMDLFCNPNSTDMSDTSCLYAAVLGGHLNIVKYLTINHNCDTDFQTDNGVTPLHCACFLGLTEMVHFLLSLNCNTDCRYGTGRTCVHAAVSKHHLEVIKCFPKDHNFDLTDFNGITPLHMACALGDQDIAGYLVQHNCDPNKRTPDGMSCLHIAVSSNNLGIVQYLVSDIGIDINVKNEKGISPVQIACGLGYYEIVQYLSSLKSCDLNSISNDGRSLFHAAVTGLNLDVVKCLARSGCDPMCKDTAGVTPLHIACALGDKDLVEYLVVELDCDPCNTATTDEMSCFEVAVSYNHLKVIKFFLEELKCDVNLDGKSEGPMLYIACAKGHLNIVKYLISHHHCDPKCVNAEGRSCLHVAAMNGKLDIVSYLIEEQNCDPSCLSEEGFTSLYAACQFGHLEVVQYLVNVHQCDPSLSIFKGRSSLHSAVLSGNLEIVKFLVENNRCDPNYHDSAGITPLHLACAQGQMHIVSYLIVVQQCDPNHRSALKGYSSIHAAAVSGNKDIIEYLVEDHRCDPNCTDDEGMTPLHIACEGGFVNIIKYLLSAHCCDPNQRTLDGRTCLHSAVMGGSLQLIKLFIEVGKCDPCCKTKYGVTPLHIACELGRTDVIHYLISSHNCDPNDKAVNGWSAYHYAASCNNVNVIKYLFKDQTYNPVHPDIKAISTVYLTFLQELMKNDKSLSDGSNVTASEPALSFLQSAASLCHESTRIDTFSHGESDVSSKRRQLIDIYQKYVQRYQNVNQTNVNISCGKPVDDAEAYKYGTNTAITFEKEFKGQVYSPLHLACRQGFTEVVQYLIATKHYDPKSTTADGRSCLHYAALGGSLPTFKYLIEEYDCDPLSVDNEGCNPIHFACTKGFVDIVEYFVSLGVSKHAMHITLFHIALQCGHLKLVQYFTSALQCDPDSGRINSLYCASENGYLNIVTYLIEKHHCDPIKKCANLDIPLHAAARNGHLEVVKYFIEQIGVDSSLEGESGNTPLHCAIQSGNVDLINYLLNETHCNPSCRDHRGQTPLHLACACGNLEVVKCICCHIIFTNEPFLDSKSNSPLHLAAANGQLNVVKYLMGYEVQGSGYSPQIISNPNTRNQSGNTPLDEARHHGHKDILRYLDKAVQHCSLSHTSVTEETKMLVIGHPKSGKSTLIKALSEDSSLFGKFRRVQHVESGLSGSVFPIMKREEFGKVSVFRFSGDTDYFITHEYVLQQFKCSLVLLVVNLSQQLHDIERQIFYWKNLLSTSSIYHKRNVIVVGSHVDDDRVDKRMDDLKSKFHQMIPFGRNVNGISYYDFVFCDCRYSSSKDMTSLCQLIGTVKKQSCLPLSDPERHLPLLGTSLLSFLKYLSTSESCITLLNLQYRILEVEGLDGKLMILSQKEKLHEICMYLKSSGHLLYLEHSTNCDCNTIVLNDYGLLENLHTFLQDVQSQLTNNFGILGESKMNEILSRDFSIASCGKGLAIKLLFISQLHATVTKDQLCFDMGEAINDSMCYFFPGLVCSSSMKPMSSKLWDNSFSKLFSWCLVCENENHCFTSKCTRLLFCELIQMAGSDARFLIWKNGILLVHNDTRFLIEFTDRNTKINLIVQYSSHGELSLILLRSKILSLIRLFAARYCPKLDLSEYFLPPQDATRPPVEIRVHTADIACAFLNDQHEIDLGSGIQGQLALSKLLVFDIFEQLEAMEIRSIVNSKDSTLAISSVMLQNVTYLLKKLPNSDQEVQKLNSVSTPKEFYQCILKYTVFSNGDIMKLACKARNRIEEHVDGGNLPLDFTLLSQENLDAGNICTLTTMLMDVVDWMSLGEFLGIPDFIIRDIKRSFHWDKRRCFIEVLAEFGKRKTNPHCGDIIYTLYHFMGMKELAVQVAAKVQDSGVQEPICGSQGGISFFKICLQLAAVDYKWFYLGLALGVDYNTLEKLECEYKLDMKTSLHSMLQIWLQNCADYRLVWPTLASALDNSLVQEHLLAEEIRKEHKCQ